MSGIVNKIGIAILVFGIYLIPGISNAQLAFNSSSFSDSNSGRFEERCCSVYPNPSNGIIYIKYTIDNDGPHQFNLYSVRTGRMVYKKVIEQVNKNDEINQQSVVQADLRDLRDGEYFLIISQGNKMSPPIKVLKK